MSRTDDKAQLTPVYPGVGGLIAPMPYQERRTTTGDGAMETPAHSITTETLLTPVRRATNRATLTIGEWFAAPVAYAKFDPVCRGVARFAGVDDLRREDWETP